MARCQLTDVAFVRSGDKGDTSDVSVFARSHDVYREIARAVTVDTVRELVGHWVTGDIRRYEVPNVLALKFVLEGALDGGGLTSLRSDNLGKALGGALLGLSIEISDSALACYPRSGTPAADPYAQEPWRVDASEPPLENVANA